MGSNATQVVSAIFQFAGGFAGMGLAGSVNQVSISVRVSEYSPAGPSMSASRIRAADSPERCYCWRSAAEAKRTRTNCESPFGTAKYRGAFVPGETLPRLHELFRLS